MPDEDKPKLITRPVPLQLWQRFVCGGGGAWLAGTGVWAALVHHQDGAGTVTFIVTGALIALLGVLGFLPTRVSGKDYSIEFKQAVEERVEKEVAVAVEELPTEARQQLAEAPPPAPTKRRRGGDDRVPGTPPRSDRFRDAAVRSVAFENSMKGRINEAAKAMMPQHRVTLSIERLAEGALASIDGFIEVDDKRALLVISRVGGETLYGPEWLDNQTMRHYRQATHVVLLAEEYAYCESINDASSVRIPGYPTSAALEQIFKFMIDEEQ